MPALDVASAGKPSEARYFAEPTSNGLGMTKQPGARCSSAKRRRFSAMVRVIGGLRHEVGKAWFSGGPAPSKLSGVSQRSYAALRAGHSLSSIANQAVSRLRPLTIMCWRNIPFEREAEALRGALRRRVEVVALPFVAAIAEVVEDIAREEILRFGSRRVSAASPGVYMMSPTSMTRLGGSMRMRV